MGHFSRRGSTIVHQRKTEFQGIVFVELNVSFDLHNKSYLITCKPLCCAHFSRQLSIDNYIDNLISGVCLSHG